jgi:uncharacterized protein YaaN involved in tellurite resistance
MDDLTRLYAMVNTQNFLIGQLYARLFAERPELRQTVPQALIEAAEYTSSTQPQAGEAKASAEMQAEVVQNLKKFLEDVERRVQESQDSQGQ